MAAKDYKICFGWRGAYLAKMNLQFIDPDYERNTLELEDVSFKEFGGK